MSERALSSPHEGRLAQVDDFHAQAIRLFEAGRQPFTNPYDNFEEAYRGGKKHLRYRDRSRPDGAIVTLFDSGGSNMPWQGGSDSELLPTVTIDTPLPVTPDWPNAYVRETFTLAPKSFRTEENPYDYQLGVAEYTTEGASLDGQDKRAVQAEFRPLDDQQDLEQEDDLGEAASALERSLNTRRLDRVAEAFPELMSRFDAERSSEHFTDRLALLSGLSAGDEVGFDQNPYIRR